MPPSTSPTGPHHHHGQHTAQRLKKLFHPEGKRIHVAHTPEEHEKLRKLLPSVEPDANFEIHLHGSPEHLQAIQQIHAFHEARRQSLRDEHADIYDEFEHVKKELDTLSEELHALTDKGVALDENFSKYGYDANIRTRDAPDSSNSSISDKNRDWNAERNQGRSIKFWRRPVVRQYFHKGLLWRSATAEQVGSFELFVDLLYVGIIAIIGDFAGEYQFRFPSKQSEWIYPKCHRYERAISVYCHNNNLELIVHWLFYASKIT